MSNQTSPLLDPPDNKPMSVQLARALGEAAEGLAMDENPFYLVAAYEPITDLFGGGFRVYGPFTSWDKVPPTVQQLVADPPHGYGFFGPYEVTLPLVNGHRVTRVHLHIEGRTDGFTFPLMPDALFFNAEAVEKFALPYYERIFGPEFARKVAEQFDYSEVQVMAHYPWSEYSDGLRVPDARLTNTPVFLFRDRPGGPMHAPIPAAGGTVALRPVTVGGRPGKALLAQQNPEGAFARHVVAQVGAGGHEGVQQGDAA